VIRLAIDRYHFCFGPFVAKKGAAELLFQARDRFNVSHHQALYNALTGDYAERFCIHYG
jgi:hypothetical protein